VTVLAITRAVPASFGEALAMTRPALPIDVERARAQHAAYIDALGLLGVRVIVLPADDACPDCCFVEDTCVVLGDFALATRPGAPSRRAEVGVVAAEVARHRRVRTMFAPATLDGGDCLLVSRTLWVGRSARTNGEGVECLRALAASIDHEVVAVGLPSGVLHLKSVCSPLGEHGVLVLDGALPASTFAPAPVITVPASEPDGANVVYANGAALVPADAPRTRALLERAGVRTVPVDTSELRKADGALTCLSILL
jgi:dimethylargininase